MQRRNFLAAMVAAVAAACSRSSDEAGQPAPPTTDTPAPTTRSTAAPTTAAPATTDPAPTPEIDETVFTAGVASGDPDDASVVIWTRVEPGSIESPDLTWEVAADDRFADVVSAGAVAADGGNTARVVVGGLSSDRTWWYRFRLATDPSVSSPVGRTRTLPAPGSSPDRVRIAVSSCQLMETGHWAAHRDLAAADIDLVLWLGDYIYEGGGSSPLPGRAHRGGEATALDGYRDRYVQYREDPALRASHAAHPWMIGWDDHEVDNDYDATVDPVRRQAGYQAWWEHQPVRLGPPEGGRLDVHRSIDIGDLARIVLTDVRQFASSTSLLGEEQWAWLDQQFDGSPRWTIVASPVMVSGLNAPIDGTEPGAPLPYAWAAYPDEQRRLQDLLRSTDSVIVSGDLHTSMVLDLRPDPDADEATTVCPELMAPAISSTFPADLAPLAPLLGLVNPQLRAIDPRNGWLLLDVTVDAITAEIRVVQDLSDPQSSVSVSSRWVVSAGDPVIGPAR